MALEVRRIVTGHDANGKAVVKTDERLQAVQPARAPAYRRLRDLVDRQDAGRQYFRGGSRRRNGPVSSSVITMSAAGRAR